MLLLKLITTYEELQLVGAQCTHTRRTFLKMRKKGKKKKKERMNEQSPSTKKISLYLKTKQIPVGTKQKISKL